jgi:hypothetical protein
MSVSASPLAALPPLFWSVTVKPSCEPAATEIESVALVIARFGGAGAHWTWTQSVAWPEPPLRLLKERVLP